MLCKTTNKHVTTIDIKYHLLTAIFLHLFNKKALIAKIIEPNIKLIENSIGWLSACCLICSKNNVKNTKSIQV